MVGFGPSDGSFRSVMEVLDRPCNDDTGGDVGVGEREGNTTIYCTLGTWVWKVNVKDYASKALLEYGSIIVLPIGTS